MSTAVTTAVLCASNHPGRGTIADAIGAPDRRTMLEAATTAAAHPFISELPEGYDTPVGDGGVILSPSQRLRLSVARILATDPPALLLDDPTAYLDAASEAAVLPGLEAVFRGRNVVVLDASPAVTAAARAAAEHAGQPSGPGAVRCPTPAPAAASALRPDPALPHLHELIDDHAMAPLLGAALEPGAVPDVRVHSVRYKPRDNVVVQYSVQTAHGWSTAVAYACAGVGLEPKRDRRRNRRLAARVQGRTPAREPLAYLPEVSALVQWMPLDIRLPLLCHTGAELGDRLARHGLESRGEEPELLRYWPRRRAVLRLGAHVLKLYRDPVDFADAARGLRASSTLRKVHTAAFEGVVRTKRTTVQAHLPGHSPSLRVRSSDVAGHLLAGLHADAAPRLARTTPESLLAKSVARAAALAQLLPELREELDALIEELAARVPSNLPLVTSHGNFHAGQLLEGPTGLCLIDLDRLCLAAPAHDLASYAAHVAFGREGEMETVTATLDSLLAGYGRWPEALEWFLANSLLRRTAVPFRLQDEHWPDAVATLVASARQVLQ